MLLNKAAQGISAIVATAVTTKLTATVEYEDTIQERVIPSFQVTLLDAGTTPILASPEDNTARRIKEIHIFNSDGATHDVTIEITLPTATPMIKTTALPVGKALHWNEFGGWAVQ